ncbi:hypothetical protein BCR34DRAFT_607729 [Clohesyomyces aquaticus]|uniref:CCHC-type domain-containing protein n=1 Tax=Clohesyomyces aquaticus TaxID=1231657 RepID=A0A1Y1YDS4_9PLEO|nr:hypothetical protein BCR34DRAFT_607729 [Clohesyomyces aquaticus]
MAGEKDEGVADMPPLISQCVPSIRELKMVRDNIPALATEVVDCVARMMIEQRIVDNTPYVTYAETGEEFGLALGEAGRNYGRYIPSKEDSDSATSASSNEKEKKRVRFPPSSKPAAPAGSWVPTNNKMKARCYKCGREGYLTCTCKTPVKNGGSPPSANTSTGQLITAIKEVTQQAKVTKTRPHATTAKPSATSRATVVPHEPRAPTPWLLRVSPPSLKPPRFQ